MFDFGAPEDTADLIRNRCLSVKGPELRRCPIDEYTLEELEMANAYTWMALQQAFMEDHDEEVVSMLKEDYDAVFLALADASEGFRESVRKNLVQYPGPRTKEQVAYYKKLARV